MGVTLWRRRLAASWTVWATRLWANGWRWAVSLCMCDADCLPPSSAAWGRWWIFVARRRRVGERLGLVTVCGSRLPTCFSTSWDTPASGSSRKKPDPPRHRT